MFKTKKQQKFINKIIVKNLLRKSIIYNKPLHINTTITKTKIIVIKNNKMFFEYVAPKINWEDDLVFLWRKIKSINTFLFKNTVDIIVCNSSFKVIETHKSIIPNTNINISKECFNIWVCKKGFIDFNKISIGDFVSTIPLFRK